MRQVRDIVRNSKKQKARAWTAEGENIAMPLIAFLNPRTDFRIPRRLGKGVPLKNDRVAHDPASNLHEIVRAFKQLDLMNGRIDLRSQSPDESERRWRRRCQKVAEIISIRMAKYASRPAVMTNERYFVVGEQSMRTAWDGDDFYRWVKHPVEQTTFSLTELQAFHALEEIIKRRWLWHLRNCCACGAWMWAKKTNNESCSDRCRKAKQRSQEAKERRRLNEEHLRDMEEGKRIQKTSAHKLRAAFA